MGSTGLGAAALGCSSASAGLAQMVSFICLSFPPRVKPEDAETPRDTGKMNYYLQRAAGALGERECCNCKAMLLSGKLDETFH